MTKKTSSTPLAAITIHPTQSQRLSEQMTEWAHRIKNRAFDLFQRRGFADGYDLEDWFAAEREFSIAFDVQDKNNNIVIKAKMPGFEAKDLNIQLDGTRLMVQGALDTGKEENRNDGATLSKQQARQIYRLIELPETVLVEKASAELRNGVLTLKLPKAGKTTGKKIEAA